MRSQVIVSWGEQSVYAFELDEVQPMPHDVARQWLDQQFTEFDCDPLRPTGKVLTADKVLAVADAAGEGHFSDAAHQAWAHEFARAVSAALSRPMVRVDLVNLTLSF